MVLNQTTLKILYGVTEQLMVLSKYMWIRLNKLTTLYYLFRLLWAVPFTLFHFSLPISEEIPARGRLQAYMLTEGDKEL